MLIKDQKKRGVFLGPVMEKGTDTALKPQDLIFAQTVAMLLFGQQLGANQGGNDF